MCYNIKLLVLEQQSYNIKNKIANLKNKNLKIAVT